MGKGIVEILPAVYDSAVDQTLWGQTLDVTASSVGAVGAMILSVENSAENPLQVGYFSTVWKDSVELITEYNRDYAPFEKDAWDTLVSGPKHEFLDTSKFWADDPSIMERPDFLFLKKVAGVAHRCAARLNDNNRWFEALTVHFNYQKRVIPASAIAGLGVVVPHIAKAMEMGRAFDLLRNRYQAVLGALDFVDVGLCIALSDGSVVVHNREAQRIFDLQDGITLGKNRILKCRQRETEAKIAEVIMSVGETARGESTTVESVFSISRPSTREPFLVEISPIRDASAEIENSLQGALVMIVDVNDTSPIKIDHLAFAYKLSGAERDVCRYLVDGWINSDIADKRGVGLETVKTQVKTIFRKTNVNSRGQLIRLAIKTSPPVRA